MMKIIDKLYKLRSTLHKFPELSFKEDNTAQIIVDFVENETKGSPLFKIHRPFLASVVVEYRNGGDAHYRIFRADMDALPVLELATNEVVSENQGIMHACGHDVHMTILCGLIAETARLRPEKNILFVFQPGEEGAGGAKGMIGSGFFDKFNIESAFALHVTDDYEVGEVASNGGVLFAIPREVDVIFRGKSAHAAYSEKGRNALAAAGLFLASYQLELQKVLSESEIFLAHFGKMSSGNARNIVSDLSKIEGTFRAFDMNVMTRGTESVEKTAKICAEKFGCLTELTILGEYIEVRNSPVLFNKLQKICSETGYKCMEKKGDLVGEDFGFFTKKWGGIMFWIGSRKAGNAPNSLHTKEFFPDFKTIDVGVEIMMLILLK